MSPSPTPRKPYRQAERLYIKQHYSQGNAATVADHLGRTVASLYQFVKRNPELLKRPRLA